MVSWMQIRMSNRKLVTLPSPIPEFQHAPLPLLVLRAGSVPPNSSQFCCLKWLGPISGLTRNLGVRQFYYQKWFFLSPKHFGFDELMFTCVKEHCKNLFFLNVKKCWILTRSIWTQHLPSLKVVWKHCVPCVTQILLLCVKKKKTNFKT